MNRRSVWAVAGLTTALIATGALAGSFGTGGAVSALSEDGARVQMLGRVRSADRESFTLTVKNMTFRVMADKSEVATRQNIREGDRVRVFGSLIAADRIDATQVQIVERAAREDERDERGRQGSRVITGTVREIQRDGSAMVLTVPAGNLKVDLDEDTSFVRSGRSSSLREFRVGDPVRIAGRRSGLNAMTARRVIYGGTPGWANGAVGEIVSLDKRTREMEVDFDGEVWMVKLGNAPIQMGGRRVGLDDLRLDQEVRVFGTSRAAKTLEASNLEVVQRGRGQ